MKSFIYRWLVSVAAVVAAVTGHIVSKNTHAGYPVRLLVVAMLSGVLVSVAARIGQTLEQRRSEASAEFRKTPVLWRLALETKE